MKKKKDNSIGIKKTDRVRYTVSLKKNGVTEINVVGCTHKDLGGTIRRLVDYYLDGSTEISIVTQKGELTPDAGERECIARLIDLENRK